MAQKNGTIFLTGGAGYIGKCLAIRLKEEGYSPLLLDNFCTSPQLTGTEFQWKQVDLTDLEQLKSVWKGLPSPTAVVHLAAHALVGESVQNPGRYFRNNVLAALNVAELASQTKGCAVVHSSSCAIYGEPSEIPIKETAEKRPVSPYGVSKWMVEQMLDQYRVWQTMPLIHLRYFNPAGALPLSGSWVGETHEPETHLIPLVVRNALKAGRVPIFGTDYPTPDGTCIRDFIHIRDLCDAHLLALKYVGEAKDPVPALNLGLGKGTSVKEVVSAAAQVLAKKIAIEPLPRRAGDPPILTADTSLASKVLSWKPRLGLTEMLQSHFQWEQSRF